MGGGARALTGQPPLQGCRSCLSLHCGPDGGSDQRHSVLKAANLQPPAPQLGSHCLPATKTALIWLSPQLQRP